MPLDTPMDRLRYLIERITPILRPRAGASPITATGSKDVVDSILRFVKKEEPDVDGFKSVLRMAYMHGLQPEEIGSYQWEIIGILMSERARAVSAPVKSSPSSSSSFEAKAVPAPVKSASSSSSFEAKAVPAPSSPAARAVPAPPAIALVSPPISVPKSSFSESSENMTPNSPTAVRLNIVSPVATKVADEPALPVPPQESLKRKEVDPPLTPLGVSDSGHIRKRREWGQSLKLTAPRAFEAAPEVPKISPLVVKSALTDSTSARVSPPSATRRVRFGADTEHIVPSLRQVREDMAYYEQEERNAKKTHALSVLREVCSQPRSSDRRDNTPGIQFLGYIEARRSSKDDYVNLVADFKALRDMGVSKAMIGNIFRNACAVMEGKLDLSSVSPQMEPARRTTGNLLERLASMYPAGRFVRSSPVSARLAQYLADRIDADEDATVESILNMAEHAGVSTQDIANLFFDAHEALKKRK